MHPSEEITIVIETCTHCGGELYFSAVEWDKERCEVSAECGNCGHLVTTNLEIRTLKEVQA